VPADLKETLMFSILDIDIDEAGGIVDRKFLLAYWLPTFVATVITLSLRAWVYGLDAVWRWWQQCEPVPGQGKGNFVLAWMLVAILILVTVVAYLLKAFTYPLIQLYEGYWPLWLRGYVTRCAQWRWERLWRKRAKAWKDGDLVHYAALQDRLYHGYPSSKERILATRLGNVLRAAEDYPGTAYGMDGIFWWPRLWPLLPAGVQKGVQDALASVLALLNSTTLIGCVAIEGAIYLWRSQSKWWLPLIVLGGGLLVAVVAYRGAVAQSWTYGQHIRAAVDVYRFDLLRALHQSLPTTPLEERDLWGRLADWLYNQDRGAVQGLTYDHGDKHRS
jgi:hypothetical protein